MNRLCAGLALLAWLVSCATAPERLPRAWKSPGTGNPASSVQSVLPRDREPVFPNEARLLRNAEKVLQDMTARSRPGIPFKLRIHAKAVVVIPRLAQVPAGARRGKVRGIAVMRSPKTGKWGRPMFVKTSAAGWELPADARVAKLALLAVTPKGAEHLLNASFNQAPGPKIALGPRGATGQLNIQQLQLANDIYAYAQVDGAYVGLAFHAPSLVADRDSDDRFYGPGALRGASFDSRRQRLPEAAEHLMALLDKIAPPSRKVFRTVRASSPRERVSPPAFDRPTMPFTKNRNRSKNIYN
ncbi:MAG: lipid-binding SYLF domain-containing protein [Nitrospinales bacterium]